MTTHIDLRPKGFCPKCGIQNAFTDRPRYDQSWIDGSERLVWECVVCGFEIRTPTVDAHIKNKERKE